MIAWARAAGYRAVQFNAVVETNTAAVRLWQSLGFGIIGTVPEGYRSFFNNNADRFKSGKLAAGALLVVMARGE